MDNIRAFLEIVFKRISPDTLIQSIYALTKKNRLITSESIDKTLFFNEASLVLPHCSEDELECIFNYAFQCMNELKVGCYEGDRQNFFTLLVYFGKHVLTENNAIPVCHYSHMLKWRMISHKLGQDIFTTSFLAYKDAFSNKNRSDFTWNPAIRSDNSRLHNILEKGMADNHFHLKGSSHIFALSWASLMNDIRNRKEQFKCICADRKRLEPDQDYGWVSRTTDLFHLVKKAALLRMVLYWLVNKKSEFYRELKNENTILSEDKIRTMLLDENYLDMNTIKIQRYIDSLHNLGGCSRENFDYAIRGNLVMKDYNNILSGERAFMYDVFKGIFKEDPDLLKYKDLFYVYLLIKSKLRGELIQVNNRVGFRNFADYQGRKSIFLSNSKALQKYVHISAIRATIEEQEVTSLEARIIPGFTKKAVINQIKNIDDDISYSIKESCNLEGFNCPTCQFPRYASCHVREEKIKDIKEKYFYVYHFPKGKEELQENKYKLNWCNSRDYKKRIEVKKSALAIMGMREDNSQMAERLRGIDACANEIGCRPEVFAQAFRFLRNHYVKNRYPIKSLSRPYSIHQLGATYHVGEDFLDIADGLRAIDEVMLFLNFKHGDRLGHALALGVNPNQWYKYKNKRIVLPKQDMLDNIVWISHKIVEFNICGMENLIFTLKKKYEALFDEIYSISVKSIEQHFHQASLAKKFESIIDQSEKSIAAKLLLYFNESELKGGNANYNIEQYYDAWKHRGNDPALYKNFNNFDYHPRTYWQSCAYNPLIESCKVTKEVRILVNAYHYSPIVRQKGAEMEEYIISEDYIKAIITIQKTMMQQIASNGIYIETNPSSNYFIGTFRSYEEHPIVKFYNIGLINDAEIINNCPQLSVSINTDDQGVFDTYLENEYALLAQALEKAKNENGEPLYNQTMIYNWLDNIREMGFEQSFKKL